MCTQNVRAYPTWVNLTQTCTLSSIGLTPTKHYVECLRHAWLTSFDPTSVSQDHLPPISCLEQNGLLDPNLVRRHFLHSGFHSLCLSEEQQKVIMMDVPGMSGQTLTWQFSCTVAPMTTCWLHARGGGRRGGHPSGASADCRCPQQWLTVDTSLALSYRDTKHASHPNRQPSDTR